jgi:hypothetical protein
MRKRFVFGLAFTALMLMSSALPAKAVLGVDPPPVPSAGQLQGLILSLVPATPTVVPPTINPDDPQIPYLPYVAIPPGLTTAMGALSPTTVVTCQVAYLGPLVGLVAITAAFDAAGVDPPVKPSFLNPLFGPVTTACVAAPFPQYTSCGPDGQITDAINGLPALPAAGPVSVDPFSLLPAPFASLVVVIASLDKDVAHYAYSDTIKPKLSKKVAKQLTCTSS